MIRTKREANREKENELYQKFTKIINDNTVAEIKEKLNITEYMYYKLYDRWISELRKNERIVKTKKYKRQNIQDGYHPWVSKILRVS